MASRWVRRRWIASRTLLIASATMVACACAGGPTGSDAASARLVLAAYTTPREAYSEIVPMFQERWLAETGQSVAFEESYVGSGAQSRAIVEGFEADVAALSLQADVDRIEAAGLIGHPWRDNGTNGMVSRSVVAFAVRPGNPKAIAEWSDLAAPSTEVLMPNPKTSGGAQWNVLAIYGAAMRGQVDGVPGDDADAALGFLASVLGNVTVMDKAARESITSFEKGIGDVAITYENEVLVGRQSGQNYELVIPSSTILIENPVAVIDEYADAHDVREVADAFAAFLTTPEAQRAFARHGLRSVDDNVAAEFAADYRPVDDLFTIEEFGGWTQATADFFGEDGLYAQAIATATAGGQ